MFLNIPAKQKLYYINYENVCLYGQLTVQLIMSSPGAPPPPLSPDGATVGAVPSKEDSVQVELGEGKAK